MKSLSRRWLLPVVALALLAVSCSSSDGTETTTVVADPTSAPADAPETPTTPPIPTPVTTLDTEDTTTTDNDSDSTSESVTDGEGAGAETGTDAPADIEPTAVPVPSEPSDTALGFVRAQFNLDPDFDTVDCIVARGDTDPALAAALTSPAVEAGQVDDTQLRAMAFAMADCIDPLALGGWATEAAGPSGDIRETAPACFAERFGDADRGGPTFYTFVALTFQFRVDPEGVPDTLDALATCTPVSSLSDFFANQAEAESNYETVIDRDCFGAAIGDKAVSVEFWSTLIEGQVPPFTVMAPYLAECAEVFEPDPDLVAEVPADFVAWSGTGALANVLPEARAGIYSAPPPMTIDPTKNYEAVLTTDGGEIRIRLFADTAPMTVNNFVNLARDGYYDGTIFHRVLADFMAQAGDPTGTGRGGPGYTFGDEVDNGPALDRRGLLAMANSGPATNGSQFFITFVPTEWLTGLHTVFGEVTAGQDIVDDIQLRDPGAPTGRAQVLDSVTIIES